MNNVIVKHLCSQLIYEKKKKIYIHIVENKKIYIQNVIFHCVELCRRQAHPSISSSKYQCWRHANFDVLAASASKHRSL